ncbi:MAG: DUF4162 domain-containing protein [Blastocatellia bacterium]
MEFRVKGKLPPESLSGLSGVRAMRPIDGGFSLTVSDTGAALHGLLAELDRQQLALDTLTTHQATLEDVFVSLTGRVLRDA